MNTEKIIQEIRRLLGQHKGSERELYAALCEEADCWAMRLQELEEDDDEE
jgi:hypothetical protein